MGTGCKPAPAKLLMGYSREQGQPLCLWHTRASGEGYKLVTYAVTKTTTVFESTIKNTKQKQFYSTYLQNNIKPISNE
jgi:hypothetical protein